MVLRAAILATREFFHTLILGHRGLVALAAPLIAEVLELIAIPSSHLAAVETGFCDVVYT